jgi:spore coat polysaccharide biosynthesis protein SpsF (cytidylyltransferase family)
MPVIAAIPYAEPELFCAITEHGYPVYTGEEHDLISRLYDCVWQLGVEAIVRITGDCPLVSSGLIDHAVYLFWGQNLDYVCNVIPRTYPDGLDIEVYSRDLITYLYYKTRGLPEWQEDFPTYFWKNMPRALRWVSFHSPVDLSSARWTVDTQEDLDWVRWVYSELGNDFTWLDVRNLLSENPNKVRTQDDYVH